VRSSRPRFSFRGMRIGSGECGRLGRSHSSLLWHSRPDRVSPFVVQPSRLYLVHRHGSGLSRRLDPSARAPMLAYLPVARAPRRQGSVRVPGGPRGLQSRRGAASQCLVGSIPIRSRFSAGHHYIVRPGFIGLALTFVRLFGGDMFAVAIRQRWPPRPEKVQPPSPQIPATGRPAVRATDRAGRRRTG